LNPNQDWLDFLEALAGQAAMAIESIRAFEYLQRSNTELALAYSRTIEGWSHALDLRDRETKDHTFRVMDMTLKLARMAGMNETELMHVKHGSLLHDIGKMGIPDAILLKEEHLTTAEWEIMRRHPFYAYEMLYPIEYLRPALDIPYCHHEKWDGTGYPRKLAGEQIPLAARLFAVVDVWDALRSDRPYRKGWAEDQVREYIRSQAGTHFEPRIVDLFLRVMEEEDTKSSRSNA
jgi:HD-GYP domain-containing protein (c-di-GMP phosphodiesterase class II)